MLTGDACRAPTAPQTINALGKKAREGTISIDDMAGGTFTISNGGVYGSLLSTPIINPPQSAILGMHSINPRPAVRPRSSPSSMHGMPQDCNGCRAVSSSEESQPTARRIVCLAAGCPGLRTV